MDGGESSGGGISGDPFEDSIINRIMLRFRPIAPKPAGNGGPEKSNAKNSYVCVGRRKRRYVRVSDRRKEIESSMEGMRKEGNNSGCRSHNNENKTQRLMINPEDPAKNAHLGFGFRDLGPSDLTIQPPEKLAAATVESRVTVLSLVDACMEDGGAWWNLEADAFPGFISDADGGVVWWNAAYRKMVAGGEEVRMRVKLVGKEWLPGFPAPAFSCMVRVQWRMEDEGKSGKTAVVPCDVWRMSNGGFAWRLDLKAGLSLGL